MASDNHNSDNDPAGNQSIPLQDLSRPPDTAIADERGRRRRTSSVSSAGGRPIPRRPLTGRSLRYERIAEDSPSPTDRAGAAPTQPAPMLTRPITSPYVSEPENVSPVDDLGGFAQAMTSVGLSFNGPQQRTVSRSVSLPAMRESEEHPDRLPQARDSMNEPEPEQYLPPPDANDDKIGRAHV